MLPRGLSIEEEVDLLLIEQQKKLEEQAKMFGMGINPGAAPTWKSGGHAAGAPAGAPVGAGQASAQASTPVQYPTPLKNHNMAQLINMIACRMRYPNVTHMPVDQIAVVAASDEEVVVVISKGGKAITLTDNGLFPSDELIASIQLLIN